MEEIYEKAYEAIREDPDFKPTEKTKDWAAESKKYKTHKLSYEQRKANIQTKIQAYQSAKGEQ